MRSGSNWTKGTASPVAAAIYAAGIALVVGYALSYLSGRLGMGVIVGRGLWHGRSALMLAALNLYAAQHITLVGSGVVPGGFGGPTHLSATIVLPLTVWFIIPAIALMWGGYVAAAKRSSAGRWGMILPAVAGGFIYVAVLTVLSRVISARFVFAAIPSVQNVEFNPPNLPFHPALMSTIICSSIFAVAFTYLGALLAIRANGRNEIAGKWWACAKAVIVTGLAVQIVVAGALWAWFAMNSPSKDSEGSTLSRFTQMLPTGAALGYSLIYGSSLSSGAVSEGISSASYTYHVNLYKRIVKDEGGKRASRKLGSYVFIATALGALGALFAGWLAVRWGSRDGSLPTALRIVILNGAYLAVLMYLGGIGWGIAGQFSAFVRAQYDHLMLASAAGVLVLAFIGAYASNRRHTRRTGGYPSA